MTYETLRYLYLGSAIACGVMTVVSIILFFALRIPKVISDLTGRTARKAIENIRKQNEASGDKTYKSSAVNLQRGKVTDKISASGRIVPQKETPFGVGSITERIATQGLADQGTGETAELAADETTMLHPAASETTVLDQQGGQAFTVEFEITFIHSNEVII